MMKVRYLLIISIFIYSCGSKEPKITLTYNQINQLDSIIKADKFSTKEWDSRGLIPSDEKKINEMKTLTDRCLTELIENGKNLKSKNDYITILDRGLKRFNKLEYDTEEKEFIADKFYEISKILSLDYKDNLNSWLYGKLMVKLEKIFGGSNKKSIDTIEIQCLKCKKPLKELVLKLENGIPEFWIIVKCNDCGKLNLLSQKKNIKENSFENCSFLKSVPKQDCDSLKVYDLMKEIEHNN